MKKLILPAVLLCTAALFAEETKTPVPEGYGNLTWGTYISDAKDKTEGRLYYSDDKKIIITRNEELEYQYGFFYMDPAKMPVRENTEAEKDSGNIKDEGKLFYVSLKFPYLTMESVKTKLTDKYGEPSFEDINKNRGALAWTSDKTMIIMWVDEYEKKPFCRKINYISRDTVKELNQYVYTMFNRQELDIIKRLNP